MEKRMNSEEGQKHIAKARTSTGVVKPNGKENTEWTVTNKKAKTKAKGRIRPETIIISSKDNLSYSEILNRVKANTDLKGFSCLNGKDPAWAELPGFAFALKTNLERMLQYVPKL